MIGKMAISGCDESCFSYVTIQLQKYSQANIEIAPAIVYIQKNKFMTRNEMKGLFHGSPEEINIVLVLVAAEDSMRNQTEIIVLLDTKKKARKLKAYILKKGGIEKSTK